MSNIIVAALYQFIPLPGFQDLQQPLKDLCKNLGVKGILLLAEEGINGTVAGSRGAIDTLKEFLEKHFDNLEYKESWAEESPFHRMKVRLKKEIVTLGVPNINPCEKVGTYVAPQDWNDLISEPDVLLIDVRNDYEVKVGTFQGALNPNTESFREFPDFVKTLDKTKHRRVAMCCTGGIRCEKASAYMLSQGFEEVYHLKGGILKYIETTPPETSRWDGECFVFDGRVTVGHSLTPGDAKLCYGCRLPLSPAEMESPLYEQGVSCPHCHDRITPEKKKAARHRQMQVHLAQSRGQKHIGAVMKSNPSSSTGQP